MSIVAITRGRQLYTSQCDLDVHPLWISCLVTLLTSTHGREGVRESVKLQASGLSERRKMGLAIIEYSFAWTLLGDILLFWGQGGKRNGTNKDIVPAHLVKRSIRER
jgi:hypothetical protein